MAGWQKDPGKLQGKTGVTYLIAMNENCAKNPPTNGDLDKWKSELGFEGIQLTDPLRSVYTDYAQANGCAHSAPGGPGCSNAVTVVIDKKMKIRHFGATYKCGAGNGNSCGKPGKINNASCQDEVLTLINQLLAE